MKKHIEDMTVKELLDMNTWVDITFIGAKTRELALKRIEPFSYLGKVEIEASEEMINRGWVQVTSPDYKITITSFYEMEDKEC